MAPRLLDERVMNYLRDVWEREPFLVVEADPCMFYEGAGVRVRWSDGSQEINWALTGKGAQPRRSLCDRSACASCAAFREEEAEEEDPDYCGQCGAQVVVAHGWCSDGK